MKFGWSRSDCESRIAAMLNCDPSRPDAWPKDTIDRILTEAERAADEVISHRIMALTGMKFSYDDWRRAYRGDVTALDQA